LGEEEIRLAKRNYGWPEDAKFQVPEAVYNHLRDGIGRRGKELRDAWFKRIEKYREQHPELARELYNMQHRQLPDGWDSDLPSFPADPKGLATRDSSGKVLNAIAQRVPWLMGGSADLAPSCKTRLNFAGADDFSAENRTGRNLHFGIREHAMAAILNGLALVKVRPYGSSFLIFSDYARAAIRLSALMELPVPVPTANADQYHIKQPRDFHDFSSLDPAVRRIVDVDLAGRSKIKPVVVHSIATGPA
jgi:transketolase